VAKLSFRFQTATPAATRSKAALCAVVWLSIRLRGAESTATRSDSALYAVAWLSIRLADFVLLRLRLLAQIQHFMLWLGGLSGWLLCRLRGAESAATRSDTALYAVAWLSTRLQAALSVSCC
jgi:hypothetical protein